jgi:hypothetical protein
MIMHEYETETMFAEVALRSWQTLRTEQQLRKYVATNQVVSTNTQSAYLDTPSKNALINLAGHMNLTRDPRAFDSIKPNRLIATLDPDVQELDKRRFQLRADIIIQFGRIKTAAHTALHEDYRTTILNLNRRKEHVKRAAANKNWEDHFKNFSNRYIDEQRRGIVFTYTEVAPTFVFKERDELTRLLCLNRDVNEIFEQDLAMNHQNALKNMISLCDRREASRQTVDSIHQKILHESPDLFSMSCSGTQYLFYFDNAFLCDLVRNFYFSRRDALIRNVLKHLRTRD